MLACLGFAGLCLSKKLADRFVLDGARPATAQLVVQTLQTMGDESVTPLADCMRSDTEIGCHRLLRSFSHAKTMRARSVSADGRLRARTIDRRCARPSSLINSVLSASFVKIPESDPILMSRTFGTEH
jgi:hypothetical protein